MTRRPRGLVPGGDLRAEVSSLARRVASAAAALAAGAAAVPARAAARWQAVRARLPRPRRRPKRSSLITHILTLQLAIVTAVGLLALTGLYWTSRTVVEDNLSHWAAQWAGELNELGAPFYLADAGPALLDVERFVDKFPEIRERRVVHGARRADV